MSDKEEIKVEPKEGEGESSEKRLFSTQDISDIQKKLEEEVDKDMKEKEDSPLETEAVQEEASGEETAEAFEDKIEKAMEKIVADTAGQDTGDSGRGEPSSAQTEKPESASSAQEQKTVQKPAQPRPAQKAPVTYNYPRPSAAQRAIRAGSQVTIQKPKKRSGKALKIAGVAAAMVVVAAGCVYGAGTYYFSNKFFVGTSINGLDCSMKTAAQVEDLIAQKVEDYSIDVKTADQGDQSIEGSSIDYKYVPDGGIQTLLDKQKPYEWVKGFFEPSTYSAEENISFDENKLKEQMLSLNCAKEENQVAPENAYVAFQDGQFVIVPETQGSMLDETKALQALEDAVSDSKTEVDFSKLDVYQKAAVTKDDPTLQATLSECNNYTKASITYTFGDQTEVLDGNTIKDWLQFDENGQFVKNDDALKQKITEWVAGLAQRHDTLGSSRSFTTTSGNTITVSGGEYGWQINQSEEVNQLFNEITTGQTVSREPLYSSRAATYGPPNDIGSTYIEVDLSAQHMYYYQDGSVIFDSDFVSGNMSYSDRATPTGIYSLYYKKSPDVLRGKALPGGGYEYETPVTYWMPFCGGVGFHDANWRSSFGGDIYLTNGSHGCINLPPSKAAELYNIIQTGVPIVMFY
ncbi:MAG TPA: peptidoglycan binding domain-containing protein [Candidatus Blautia intestinigallinarum]|nr:peptidoglycan binding domain-containing protein [Candidatus Blautia intestinigallinarum]